MSICSCCYSRFSGAGFNVGQWWNNDPDISKVCSTKCKKRLWVMVQNGTWMTERKLPRYRGEVVPIVPDEDEVKQVTQNWANSEAEVRRNGPVALTDKQFGKSS